MFLRGFFVFVFVLSFGISASARTFLGEGAFRKSQEKESTRWTLADWMTQKKQFNAMDQWLALNKSLNLFEINIEGGRRTYDVTIGANTIEQEIERGSISLYWSIFGIEYQFENSTEDFKRESGQINLRLLGASSQTTNLTAFYGMSSTEYENTPLLDIENQYAGARLNIYLVSFFGIEGMYRKDFRERAKNDDEYERERVEYGAFFDVYFVRVYGQGFKETTNITPAAGAASEEEREGVEAGVKFYF